MLPNSHTLSCRTLPQCDLRLVSGTCQAGGQAYTKAIQTNNTVLQAIPSQGVHYSYLNSQQDLVCWLVLYPIQPSCSLHTLLLQQ